MHEIEQALTSLEVAEMVRKDHAMLLRDLRRYEKQFTECNLAVSDFFRKSEYKDSTGRTLPCYYITKKGCEFIAHKLTGTKGTEFTAKYINRFHEMETELSTGANQEILLYLKDKLEKQDAVLADIKRQIHMRRLPVRSQHTIQDRYKAEIERMVGTFTNQDYLCSIYTVCKTLSS
nr:Rha family transcriptional regulator [uncultured Schaedlerella sp.]